MSSQSTMNERAIWDAIDRALNTASDREDVLLSCVCALRAAGARLVQTVRRPEPEDQRRVDAFHRIDAYIAAVFQADGEAWRAVEPPPEVAFQRDYIRHIKGKSAVGGQAVGHA